MDKYLDTEASYQRLLSEYKKYGSLIVCVDFDDSVYDFHSTGGSYEMVRQLVRDLYAKNCYIIIWTGNEDTEFVSSFLKENNIPYHSINEECPAAVKAMGSKKKIYSNVTIDDRIGMAQVYNELTRLLNEI